MPPTRKDFPTSTSRFYEKRAVSDMGISNHTQPDRTGPWWSGHGGLSLGEEVTEVAEKDTTNHRNRPRTLGTREAGEGQPIPPTRPTHIKPGRKTLRPGDREAGEWSAFSLILTHPMSQQPHEPRKSHPPRRQSGERLCLPPLQRGPKPLSPSPATGRFHIT